ncbi:MAG TPA: RNA 3'-terminal phosphate cyclase [Pyrinomonadaceae bacterium]|jgi:RNA 3'-terminal phosphate cyclase (ATP)|nr:RNA 3'-terminal phosphate cyclase [Pyrinomonadaceae bacterium]
MISIDGSYGEGGGQIIRTSLALALVTGKPFRIERVRARRARPGLQRQHLTAVNAAAEIGRAETSGAAVGSAQFTFIPREVVPGDYTFSIGTAGSATLVLQTILPPLAVASRPSRLALEGGTHNVHAPPFEFLAETFLPLVSRMGPKVTAELKRYGFYPPGGGRFEVSIEPVTELLRLDIAERGPLLTERARSLVVNLPRGIAERELAVVREMLGWGDDQLELAVSTNALSPGNVLTIRLESEQVTEIVTGMGERGVRAETVAERAVAEARSYIETGAPVGVHLADQLLVPLALAGGGSFLTGPLSLHATTNISVIRKFLDVRIQAAQLSEHIWKVEVENF